MGRTLLVATTTLAILAVCYAMYEFSQPDRTATSDTQRPRLPPVPTGIHDEDPDDSETQTAVSTKAGDVAIADVGKTHLRVFDDEGTESRLEITVSKWAPLPGATNEFSLAEPELRLRTNNGHSVRATATEGTVEAEPESKQLRLLRGELTGSVVIEIDRLTDRQRAALPDEIRHKIDPAQVVRLECDKIIFDREYSKVIVDGPLHLIARDAELRVSDVEVRFNEAAGRIEYARFNAGGTLELTRDSGDLGLAIPGMASGGPQAQTLVDWMRSSLEAKLAQRQQTAQADAATDEAESAEKTTSEGLPVFDAADDTQSASEEKPAIAYNARFEGAVDARQYLGDIQSSQLLCDALEVLRDFSDRDRRRVRSAAETTGPSTPGVDEATGESRERIVLRWTDRLVVDVVDPSDSDQPEIRSKIVATGSPVRLSNPRGGATSRELTFNPDGGLVSLTGSDEEPVTVFVPGQGTISGVEVHSRQTGDGIHVRVVGPGFLRRNADQPDDTTKPADAEQTVSRIDFGEALEIRGREVTRTAVDITKGLAGAVSSRQARVIDTAVFTGRARMHDGDTYFDGDTLTIDFNEQRDRGGTRQTIRRVRAVGNAVMSRAADRLTCDALDLELSTDEEGRPVPTKATATGHVNAIQGTRTILARESLVVDFKPAVVDPKPFDVGKVYRKALAEGVDVATIDWEEARRKHESRRRVEPIVTRLRAARGVEIVDPTQGVDLSADSIDCAVVNGREIETAEVVGTEDRPASVRIEAFTVVGPKVRVNVVEDWAEVPGAGRMTFLSNKDLDGRAVAELIPISVTWDDWMRYRGERDEARFVGNVHATSESTTTFDCDELLVLFQEAVAKAGKSTAAVDWWLFQGLADRLGGRKDADAPRLAGGRFSKEPIELVAIGHAKATLAEVDDSTGELTSRAFIRGPRLRVDLRPEVSKMLIEGAGNLLLEDFRPAVAGETAAPADGAGLLDMQAGSGPSKTLISWQDVMWYDFLHHQTVFEGDVQLIHISGSEVDKRFATTGATPDETATGRRASLGAQRLSVDFVPPDGARRSREAGRMGGLSAARLRRFHAEDSVDLRDPAFGIWLSATTVTFERDRHLLAIHGTDRQRAVLTRRRPGELPFKTVARRIYFDTETEEIEAKDPLISVP